MLFDKIFEFVMVSCEGIDRNLLRVRELLVARKWS